MAGNLEVTLVDLIGMRMRKTPPELIVGAAFIDRKRGGATSIAELEATYMAHPGKARTPTDLLILLDKHREDAAKHS